MYTTYFSLTRDPFRLTPDPRFFYASPIHQRGLAYLRFAFHQGEGFVVITGAPGTGKTELMMNLASRLSSKEVILSQIVSTNLHANDLLALVAASFLNIGATVSKGLLLKKLEDFFISQARTGKQMLLLIDEAHNLSTRALIELSMLSNFQLNSRPVMQCFLLGQEPLEQKLEQPELAHLKQRIIASTHLQNLDVQETQAYIEHRLKIAGWQGDPSISISCYALIHRFSNGTPRRINIACSRIMLEACLEERHQIDVDLVDRVLQELRTDSLWAPASTPGESGDPATSDRQPLNRWDTDKDQAAPAAIEIAAGDAPQPDKQRATAPAGRSGAFSAPKWPQTIVAVHRADTDTGTIDPYRISFETLPDTVATSFNTPSISSAAEQENLVMVLPDEETVAVNDARAPSLTPLLIDPMSHELHRLTNNPHADSILHPGESFAFQTLLDGLPISRAGLVFSATMLIILWWFIYGPGTGVLLRFLRVIFAGPG